MFVPLDSTILTFEGTLYLRQDLRSRDASDTAIVVVVMRT
jgi:hypothetical protein